MMFIVALRLVNSQLQNAMSLDQVRHKRYFFCGKWLAAIDPCKTAYSIGV